MNLFSGTILNETVGVTKQGSLIDITDLCANFSITANRETQVGSGGGAGDCREERQLLQGDEQSFEEGARAA
jgi:hypothetical protein